MTNRFAKCATFLWIFLCNFGNFSNMKNTKELIQKYYNAFNNSQDAEMLSCLTDDIAHDSNQGKTHIGKAAFQKFIDHMNTCYKETLTDMVIMVAEDGKRASAEFMVNGKYLKTDSGLPEARGQEYKIRAGTFFEIKENKISRVTTYYNLPLWIEMVK